METTAEVVEFEIGGVSYALDICLAREIMEMMPLTPIPRAPQHIAGIINLRGEITNIIDLNLLLGMEERTDLENRKIIVLVPEIVGGSHLGVIVDDVKSVTQVSDSDIEKMDPRLSQEAYVKGVIVNEREEAKGERSDKNLIIWIDMQKMINELMESLQA